LLQQSCSVEGKSLKCVKIPGKGGILKKELPRSARGAWVWLAPLCCARHCATAPRALASTNFHEI
jgi:hypothetical protein